MYTIYRHDPAGLAALYTNSGLDFCAQLDEALNTGE